MAAVKDSGDPDPIATVAVGVIGTLVVILIVLVLQVLYYRTEASELQSKVYSQPPHALLQLRAEQQERLRSYRWVDKGSGVLAIPIERAMELVVREESERARQERAQPERGQN